MVNKIGDKLLYRFNIIYIFIYIGIKFVNFVILEIKVLIFILFIVCKLCVKEIYNKKLFVFYGYFGIISDVIKEKCYNDIIYFNDNESVKVW